MGPKSLGASMVHGALRDGLGIFTFPIQDWTCARILSIFSPWYQRDPKSTTLGNRKYDVLVDLGGHTYPTHHIFIPLDRTVDVGH